MKKLLMLWLAFGLFNACQKDQVEAPIKSAEPSSLEEIVKNRYIVIFKELAVDDQLRKYKVKPPVESVVSDMTLDMNSQYHLGNSQELQIFSSATLGCVIYASEEKIEQLRSDPRVASIDADKIVTLSKCKKNNSEPSTQIIPYGINRVGGPQDGSRKRAWILDTGVDPDHPDLNISKGKSKAFITGAKKPIKYDDLNGHGTHIAGIIGAIDNNIGTAGIAAGCEIVAVRVLNANGSGLLSDFISGLDYIHKNSKAGEVVNVSIGLPPADAMDAAILSCAKKGLFMAIAAGNSAADAINTSPARLNADNVFTVSAMDSTDNWASFSNYGSSIDYCAPGVDIISTYLNGGYATMSGTSSAAPHMAGILLMTGGKPETSGYVKNDPDSTPDPIGHL